MATLGDEIYSIMNDAMKEILEKTEGHNSARNYLVDNVCRSCILVLTNTKYKKDEKIASFKRQIDYYISDIDKAIQDFSNYTRK